MMSGFRTVVVTGVTGFVGPHLAVALREAGFDVVGVGRESSPHETLDGILDEYIQADLIESAPPLPECLAVIHLAGLAAVGSSFAHPQKYIHSNSAMVTSLGEAMLGLHRRPRWLAISSGSVYAGSANPLDESAELGFSSPYAVSKVLGENQLQYYRGRGLDVVVARPFNHSGPGQRQGYLLPDLIEQVRASMRSGEPIRVGELSTVRDYTDVRDVVRAYVDLATAENLEHQIYNVCSGVGLAGYDVLQLVLVALGAEDVEIVRGEIRPNDTPVAIGDPGRLQSQTGWRPIIPFAETVRDVVAGEAAR